MAAFSYVPLSAKPAVRLLSPNRRPSARGLAVEAPNIESATPNGKQIDLFEG